MAFVQHTHAAFIEMAFESEEAAQKWADDAEELGAQRNAELLEKTVEEL